MHRAAIRINPRPRHEETDLNRPRQLARASALVVLAFVAPTLAAAALSKAVADELAEAKFVYVSSLRRDGHWSKPAEIWFLFHDGAVYVASAPTSWRAKRIRAGRAKAKIAVERPDGPSFTAVGEIVDEPKLHPLLFATYAKKYPEGWPKFEESFRRGLKDGRRVLIRYTPQ